MKTVLGIVVLLAIGGGVWYFVNGGATDLENIKEKAGELIDRELDDAFDLVHHYFHTEEKPHAAHWSYSGDTGPEHWGDLDTKYRLAKTGKQQSPINIVDVESAELSKLKFNYVPTGVHLINNGHTIKQDDEDDDGGYFTAGDDRFDLKQFHFHAPSEHTVNGQHFPMEMHLVHKSPDEKTVAVVAVFIEQGEQHNQAFDRVWSLLPFAKQTRMDLPDEIDTAELLPKEHHYSAYQGSFTTPPCTEGVKWFVLKTPVKLSKDQVERFCAVINNNNRPVQPLNSRRITESK